MDRARIIPAVIALLLVGGCQPPATPLPQPEPAAYAQVAGQYQQHTSWCAPASASMSLVQMGVTASQATLATAFGTTLDVGTTDTALMLSVLDRYATPRGYAYLADPDASNPITLGDVLNLDLNGLRQDPILAVEMQLLPWDPSLVGRADTGHAMVATAYDPASQTVTVWDPWQPTGGVHTLSLLALARVLQPGLAVIEVTRLG